MKRKLLAILVVLAVLIMAASIGGCAVKNKNHNNVIGSSSIAPRDNEKNNTVNKRENSEDVGGKEDSHANGMNESKESNLRCSRLTDDACLLSTWEKNSIEERLNASSTKWEFDFVIVTTNTLNGETPRDYADNFYDDNNFGYGSEKDGVLLLVSMEDRDWWITTTGFGIQAIDDSALDNISNAFLNDLSSGNYYDAFISFVDAAETTVEKAIKEGR